MFDDLLFLQLTEIVPLIQFMLYFFLLPNDPADSTYLKLLFKFCLADIFHILVRCSVVPDPHTGVDHCPWNNNKSKVYFATPIFSIIVKNFIITKFYRPVTSICISIDIRLHETISMYQFTKTIRHVVCFCWKEILCHFVDLLWT